MLETVNNWDKLQTGRGASFLQSSLWGQFQESIGNQPYQLQGKGWTCLVLLKHNQVGRYLFAPYGPILNSPSDATIAISELQSQAKTLGADWLKLEPMTVDGQTDDLRKALKTSRLIKASRDIEPALTRIVDISLPPDELLATISQSTRSIIRKNQRENSLTFKTSTDPADIKIFTHMLDTVADRRGIGFFSQKYFLDQAKLLMPEGMLYLELAYDGNQPVGGALIHDYGQISCYTFAAALPEAHSKSAAALLLWQVILNAKNRGSKTIDLYGSAPDDAPASHPWYGLSANKRKFGGQLIDTAGTWDLPITNKYRLYRWAQRAQKFKRRIKRR